MEKEMVVIPRSERPEVAEQVLTQRYFQLNKYLEQLQFVFFHSVLRFPKSALKDSDHLIDYLVSFTRGDESLIV